MDKIKFINNPYPLNITVPKGNKWMTSSGNKHFYTKVDKPEVAKKEAE